MNRRSLGQAKKRKQAVKEYDSEDTKPVKREVKRHKRNTDSRGNYSCTQVIFSGCALFWIQGVIRKL